MLSPNCDKIKSIFCVCEFRGGIPGTVYLILTNREHNTIFHFSPGSFLGTSTQQAAGYLWIEISLNEASFVEYHPGEI